MAVSGSTSGKNYEKKKFHFGCLFEHSAPKSKVIDSLHVGNNRGETALKAFPGKPKTA